MGYVNRIGCQWMIVDGGNARLKRDSWTAHIDYCIERENERRKTGLPGYPDGPGQDI